MAKRKVYPIEKSPLFRMRNKAKLSSLLGVSKQELELILADPPWHVWMRRENGKEREIQEPKGRLRSIHDKLQALLSRIQTPEYLFSGKKGLSSVDNAKYHLGGKYFLKTDIEKFFPSCKREYLFRFFVDKAQMDDDAAWTLVDIVCYDGHTPTGSPVSGTLAYWANAPAFDEIHSYAKDKGLKMSLFVDDMVFSSPEPIPKDFHLYIDSVLKRRKLHLKKKKTEYSAKNVFKKITGAAISPSDQILPPNKIQESIFKKVREIKKLDEMSDVNVRKTLGEIRYLKQISKQKFDGVYRKLKEREKELNKKHLLLKAPV